VGFPIRRSSDQSSFAAPQGLSQRTTSFIASQRQGIHQMLLRHLITLMIDVRALGRGQTRYKRKTCLQPFGRRHILLAKHIRRPWLRAMAGSQELGVPLAEYAASLRCQTSAPLTRKGRARTSLMFRIQKNWWSLSGSNRRPEACKATALPAELRPHVPRRNNSIMVGLGRLERPTSPLSGVRSNHLSYRPEPRRFYAPNLNASTTRLRRAMIPRRVSSMKKEKRRRRRPAIQGFD
jgi:hypothetical protein